MIRSATSNTSTMLCEIRTTPTAWSARRRTRSSTCRVWATPERRGRLVEEDHLGIPQHRLGDRHGLTLAAGEAGDRLAHRLHGAHRQPGPGCRGALVSMRDLVEHDAGVAARGRGTCSRRCRGCRTGRGPGRRPRRRARPRRAGRARSPVCPRRGSSPLSMGWMPAIALTRVRLAGAVVTDERGDLTGVDAKSTSCSTCTTPKLLLTPRSSRIGLRRTVSERHVGLLSRRSLRDAPAGARSRGHPEGRVC